MSYTTITSILLTQLNTVSGLPILQRENTANIAKTGIPFARATLIPSRSIPLGLGATSTRQQLSGLMQIDLFYPVNVGTPISDAMVDLVIAAFPRMMITTNGISVQIETAWREGASRVEQFYNVPVMVQWSCIR